MPIRATQGREYRLVIPLANPTNPKLFIWTLLPDFDPPRHSLMMDPIRVWWWHPPSDYASLLPFRECIEGCKQKSAATIEDGEGNARLFFDGVSSPQECEGASYQLPLSIACWALALAEATDDPCYLKAAQRYTYTGSPTHALDLMQLPSKAEICRSHALGSDRLLALTPRNSLEGTIPPGVELHHEFADIFARAFEGCPLSQLEPARQRVTQWWTRLSDKHTGRDTRAGENEAIWLLVRCVPLLADYRWICDQLQIPISRSCDLASIAERWSTAVRYCRERGQVRHLMQLAASRVPGPRLRRLSTDTGGQTYGDQASPFLARPDRQVAISQIDKLKSTIAGLRGRMSVETGSLVAEFVGLCALSQAWAQGQHSPQEVDVYLGQLDEQRFEAVEKRTEEAARSIGLVDKCTRFASAETCLCLAADYLASRFDEHPDRGRATLHWMLTHLDEPATMTPMREELLALTVRWWSKAVRVIAAWQQSHFDQPYEALTGQEKDRILERLIRSDQVLMDSGQQTDDAFAAPASIRWVYRAGLVQSAAGCLERIGERELRHYETVFDQLLRCGADHGILVQLARSMRRLAEDGADANAIKPPGLRTAILAALPDADEATFRRLSEEDRSAMWWLEIVPFIANPAQIRRLCEIYQGDAGWGRPARRRKQAACLALASQLHLSGVWDCLGSNVGRWLGEIRELGAAGANVDLLLRERQA